MPCDVPSECPDPAGPCEVATCENNTCGFEPVPQGTALAVQTVGDCQVEQCDGAGATEEVPDDADLPDDSNDCTDDVCTAGVPSNPNHPAGQTCGAGLACNGSGQCTGCVTPAQCGTDDECTTHTCVASVCGQSFTAAGTAVSTQTDGDCLETQCDGAGNEQDANDDADLPEDNNDCTVDECNAGVPSNDPVAEGDPCDDNGGAVCDDGGQCVECNVALDCGVSNDCESFSCSGTNTCSTMFAALGFVTSSQTPGDCSENRCDGAGNEVPVNLDSDVPVDMLDCTVGICTAGVGSQGPAPLGTTCDDSGGDVCNASGGCVECNTFSDCPGTETECGSRTCNSNLCGMDFEALGTLLASQTNGNCQDAVCDGTGGTTTVNNNSDIPVDALDCTIGVCNMGVGSQSPVTSGTACDDNGGQVCDGAGACVQCVTGAQCPLSGVCLPTNVCEAPICGNLLIQSGEQCDDGNTTSGDGCSATCQDEFCGDGIDNDGTNEECDDANSDPTDGCTATCELARVCNVATFPGGDRFSVDLASGNCFVSYDDDQQTFAAAQAACSLAGGHLATVTSAAENSAMLAAQNTAQNPWIGAVDDANDTDAVFDWVTDEAFGFTNFALGQPDDDAGFGGNGECLHLVNPAGEWNDTNCNFAGFVTGRICEFDLAPCGNAVVEAGEDCDDGGTVSGDGCSSTCATETLFFSEYVEGSSNNKVLEIRNPSSSVPFDLAANTCSLRLYTNGAAAPSSTLNLTATIAPNDVLVACHSSSVAGILAVCDVQNSSVMNFNGDDALELFCNGSRVDLIGEIGVDPGTNWGTAPTSTVNQTLRRKCTISNGDTVSDTFDPAVEFGGFAIDTIDDLGLPGCAP